MRGKLSLFCFLLGFITISFAQTNDEYKNRYLKADSLFLAGEYEKARILFESVLWSYDKHNIDGIMMGSLHSLGDLHLYSGDTLFAQGLFEKSVLISNSLQDSFLLCRSLNQLGRVKMKRGFVDEGIDLLEQAYQLAEGYKDTLGMAGLRNNLALAYRSAGNCEESIRSLLESKQLYEESNNFFGHSYIYLNMYFGYECLGENKYGVKYLDSAFASAVEYNNNQVLSRVELEYYEYYKEGNAIEKALLHYENHIEIERKIESTAFEKKMTASRERWENLKHSSTIQKLELERESNQKSAKIRNIVIGGLVIFVGLLIYVLFREMKSRRIIQNLFRKELERQRVLNEQEMELEKLRSESKSRQILMNTIIQSKKNEVLKRVEETLDTFLLDQDITLIKSLKSEIKFDKKVEQDWDNFKKHFESVHPNFLMGMKTNYPSLTQNNLKLAAYIKMGLDNKEIANLMSITIESVKSAKKRLKKKLGVSPGELFVFDGI